ncbi:MAG: DHH family phosphoesterase [Bacteriovoracaceae bacterium]|nr:DHH family phosphoesterase [Bacteriovoracaceae bacterium]
MKNSELFRGLITSAENILITTHTDPDADGIGSQIALGLGLKKMLKNVFCVNEQLLNKRYSHLDSAQMIESYDSFMQKNIKELDLMIILDTNSPDRIGENMQKIIPRCKRVLFIDHHPCPPELHHLHCVDVKAAATGELLGKMMCDAQMVFCKEMARALYTAILIDTSSFRYPTVTGETHRFVAKLLETGITPDESYNEIYATKKIQHMKLLGEVLSSAATNSTENIAWIMVTEEMVKKYSADIEDTHSFINNLLVLSHVKIACMFRSFDHKVKVSLRSRGDVDVGNIAGSFGGGGHNHSAAFITEGELSQVISQTVEKLGRILIS